MTSRQRSAGFMALFTVIALSAFSLSLILSVAYLSINASQEGWMLARGEAALQFTEGCAEDALLHASRDESYDGGSYEYLGGECTVDISKDDTVWTVDISGTKEQFTRSVRIIFDYTIGPPGIIKLRSWLER